MIFKTDNIMKLPAKMIVSFNHVYGAMLLESLNHKTDVENIAQGC